VIGLLGFGLNFGLYAFIIAYFDELIKHFTSKTEQTVLQMQIDTMISQIEEYKNVKKQAAIFRHDFRHHIQYLNACIVDNQREEALSYIAKISNDVEVTYVVQYCENISINLILSAYVAKAKKNGISIDVQTIIPTNVKMDSVDICVILANGIENAMNACRKMDEKENLMIKINCSYQQDKFKIQIQNSFSGSITFKEDIPISCEENHGLGITSMIAISKKYHGIYSFTAEQGIFQMRMILQGIG
jgi:sensor histidine kinase regulating citrate/malate metabolism